MVSGTKINQLNRFPQFNIQKWLFLSDTNKLLLVVFFHCYLEGLISEVILKQVLDIIQQENKQHHSITPQDVSSLVYKMTPYQQMGFTIFLRQDLINELQEVDPFPMST
mmetsp:Transcript_36948/g.35657  ORF Transcript_36948/g.35657 Transcript_36948/m.35657 type:complete len:109 (-) Transcript_36948:2531-2857(-)